MDKIKIVDCRIDILFSVLKNNLEISNEMFSIAYYETMIYFSLYYKEYTKEAKETSHRVHVYSDYMQIIL